MRMWQVIAGVSAVVLLTGTTYAGHSSSCCEKSTVTSTSERAIISGNPCSSCEKPCSPCKVRCCKIYADIEKLRAVQPQCSTDLCIEYQVETKCTANEPVDLLVQIKSGDRIVYEKLVALENGTPGNKPGKFHFKGQFSDSLDQVYNDGKTRLLVEGNVVKRGTVTSIDRERERVVSTDDGWEHGFAQPLYTTGQVLYSTGKVFYTPVRWITPR